MIKKMGLIANIFGYVLNFIYYIVGNYGFAIILFTILLKVLLLPLTYKQQVTMRKSAKIQDKVKIIQFKYKNDPEKMNKEVMDLYKRENANPLSGCLSGIVQIIIFLSVFYLVSSPLTYMKKLDESVVNGYIEEYITSEETTSTRSAYQQINLIREKGNEIEDISINMDFLGLDLSLVPLTDLSNPTVYIIPVLYVISSIVSIKLSTDMNKKPKKKEEDIDNNEEEEIKDLEKGTEDKNKSEIDTAEAMTKNMTYVMPIMSVMISMIAPLGLALYWLTNNVLMIIERIGITKYVDKKEEKQ